MSGLLLTHRDVVVGLLTENTRRMTTQAIRLLRSIRWFGGELARSRVVVCTVGELDLASRRALEELGAELRPVTRFHPANPTANRHQMIAELLEAPEQLLLLLDCDVLVTRDPLPYLRADVFQAKVAPSPTVADDVFQRLFAHFGLPMPARSKIAAQAGVAMIPYYNAGVIAIGRLLARRLAPVWREYNLTLADHPELVAPSHRHMHQAALALALAATGIPCADLPDAMNFQINAPHVPASAEFEATDPVILHYHHLGSDDGFLLPTRYPNAQLRIDRFHERMRAEGFQPDTREPERRKGRPVVIVGMHRSGTSVVAQLANSLGLYAGRTEEFAPPDMFNPTGFWEHNAVVKLDNEILERLGATWFHVDVADPTLLPLEEQDGYVARMKSIVANAFDERGPFLLKDPRFSLLLPLWRRALDDPFFVIAWRHPVAVARSLATRDGYDFTASLAVWEHHSRTLLRDTAGFPRILVSYERLVAEPAAVAAELHAALAAAGIDGLIAPSPDELGRIVKADFNRSGGADDDARLSDDQRAILDGLRSGTILDDPPGPTPDQVLSLIAAYRQFDRAQREMREMRVKLLERERLLDTIFSSRSWKLGHLLTGIVRGLRQINDPSAEDHWRSMRGDRS